MDNHNLLLPQILNSILPPLRRIDPKQEQCWALLFTSCPTAQTISASQASRYMRGKQRIGRSYVVHYADLASPRYPTKLHDDVLYAITMLNPNQLECQQMYVCLENYGHTYIDPIDLPIVLPDVAPHCPTIDIVSSITTRLLWHAICHDVAVC